MLPEEWPAVVLWFAGVLLMLFAVLMVIAQTAIYRHTGQFKLPWRRTSAPFFAGAILLSTAMALLGAHDLLIQLWLAIAGLVILVSLLRRSL